MLPYLLQAAAVIGATCLAYTIPPPGYIRRSSCPEAGVVTRLFAETQLLTVEKLEVMRMLERRDVDFLGATKTIADLTATVEKQSRELAKFQRVRDPVTGRIVGRAA